jgi:hypothetical protein
MCYCTSDTVFCYLGKGTGICGAYDTAVTLCLLVRACVRCLSYGIHFWYQLLLSLQVDMLCCELVKFPEQQETCHLLDVCG